MKYSRITLRVMPYSADQVPERIHFTGLQPGASAFCWLSSPGVMSSIWALASLSCCMGSLNWWNSCSSWRRSRGAFCSHSMAGSESPYSAPKPSPSTPITTTAALTGGGIFSTRRARTTGVKIRLVRNATINGMNRVAAAYRVYITSSRKMPVSMAERTFTDSKLALGLSSGSTWGELFGGIWVSMVGRVARAVRGALLLWMPMIACRVRAGK